MVVVGVRIPSGGGRGGAEGGPAGGALGEGSVLTGLPGGGGGRVEVRGQDGRQVAFAESLVDRGMAQVPSRPGRGW